MKQSSKKIFFLFFAIIIAIILIDCVIDGSVSCGNKITSNRECSELPGHFDDPHLTHFDDFSCFDSAIPDCKLICYVDLAGLLSIDLNNNYLTCIWQPPKFA